MTFSSLRGPGLLVILLAISWGRTTIGALPEVEGGFIEATLTGERDLLLMVAGTPYDSD